MVIFNSRLGLCYLDSCRSVQASTLSFRKFFACIGLGNEVLSAIPMSKCHVFDMGT